MISGSRLGASSVVLVVGVIEDLLLRDGLVVEETLDAFEAGAFHLLVAARARLSSSPVDGGAGLLTNAL